MKKADAAEAEGVSVGVKKYTPISEGVLAHFSRMSTRDVIHSHFLDKLRALDLPDDAQAILDEMDREIEKEGAGWRRNRN